jgi:hypothetical protein
MRSGSPQPALEVPKRWPLISKLQTRNADVPLTQDARLINCYAEFDPEDEEFWIYKRLGLGAAPVFGPGGASGWGMYTYYQQVPNWSSGNLQVLGLFGNGELYSYNPVTQTTATIGSIAVTSYQPMAFFETVNSSPQTVVIGTANAGYVYTPSTKVLTQITDAGFPSSVVPGWGYLDGTLYVMSTSGAIYNSQVNQPSVWSPQSIIQASSNADAGVALAKQLNYIVAFKQWTTQVFYDAGNTTGSPLAPVPDSQLPYGCFAAGSIAQIDNTLLWMTSNQTISPQIVRMDFLSPQIVSTPAVERILDNAALNGSYPGSGIWSMVLKHGGHRFYFLTIVALNITLVYDLDQPPPSNWYIWTDPTGANFWPITSIGYIPPLQSGTSGVHLAQHTDGYVFPLDGDYEYPSDGGAVFPVDIYTPNFDGGTDRRKVLKMLFPNADQYGTPGQLSTLQVRFNDDDYAPTMWSNFRSCDLSLRKPRIADMGTFYKRRALHLRYAAPTSFRIKSLDLQLLWGSR